MAALLGAARSVVSQKKVRYQLDGFDLDLTYITNQVIAMGFPTEGAEAAYRNPMSEVQRFFQTKHAGHYRIYNLCIEKGREYTMDKFEDICEDYQCEDHNPMPLKTLHEFAVHCTEYLKQDPKNVAAIRESRICHGLPSAGLATHLSLHAKTCRLQGR